MARIAREGATHSEAMVESQDASSGLIPVHDALVLLDQLAEAAEPAPLVGVHCVDQDGVVCYWSARSAELYGIDEAHAVGRPVASLLQPDSAAEHAALLDAVWRSGQPAPARDWRLHSVVGRALWICSTALPLRRGGQVLQVFCMDIDVTARKQEDQAMTVSPGHFREMYQRSEDAILLLHGDRIGDVNPATLRMFKCAGKEAMAGRSLADFSPLRQPNGQLSARAGERASKMAEGDDNLRYEWRFLNCAGGLFWAEVLMTSISAGEERLSYVVVRDISARKQAERTLHLAAQVFENSRDAIVLTDQGQHIIAVNQAYSDITGYSADDMLGEPVSAYRSGVEDDAFYRQLWHQMRVSGHWQGEITARRKQGELFPAWLSLTTIRDSEGRLSNYMGILSDITDRKKTEQHTRHLAEHDFLTDLPNRVLLLDRLSLALAAARRNQTMLAVLFVDLDHFKDVNDTLGHQVGDNLLKEIAGRLVRCVRGADTVSRQGGDEFLIILADIGGVDQAAHVAASVLQAIGQPYQLGPHQLQVSASIGVSLYPNDGDGMDQLVRNADIAMYHAKENGRNAFQFFNGDMHVQIAERVALENGLRMALRRQEFELAFEAQIDLASGQPVGMEALLRWRHPEQGLLPPERFMTVAEDAGLMVPIGAWMLHQACREAQRWRLAGHALAVAVKLSAAQFAQKDLPAGVGAALGAAGLPPQALELEVNEAIILRSGAPAQDMLQRLHALGVRLTIDEFGTGYSSLGRLGDAPVEKLKIDRSFVAAGGDGDVASAIIAMARSLKMLVIAEGVETDEQLDFLRSQGCDQYQGPLAADHLPAAITALLA
jgi:diguanylate cyclase (GGDEF)-like protein/PAS domain S-box-containing protein